MKKTTAATYGSLGEPLSTCGHDFKPASSWGGFEFSEPEILRIIDRQIRYDYARYFANTGKGRQPNLENDPQIDMAA